MVGAICQKEAAMMVDGNSRLRYPDWQLVYESALLDGEPLEIVKRVTEAENAIFRRLQALDGDHLGERQAIEHALQRLLLIKEEKLGHPDWQNKTSE
jgi:hypothetical protein